jgi:hypothetical protein
MTNYSAFEVLKINTYTLITYTTSQTLNVAEADASKEKEGSIHSFQSKHLSSHVPSFAFADMTTFKDIKVGVGVTNACRWTRWWPGRQEKPTVTARGAFIYPQSHGKRLNS